MTLREANLKVGDYFMTDYGECSDGPWVIESIVERGAVVVHKGALGVSDGKPYVLIVPGSHKHLCQWDTKIKTGQPL